MYINVGMDVDQVWLAFVFSSFILIYLTPWYSIVWYGMVECGRVCVDWRDQLQKGVSQPVSLYESDDQQANLSHTLSRQIESNSACMA